MEETPYIKKPTPKKNFSFAIMKRFFTLSHLTFYLFVNMLTTSFSKDILCLLFAKVTDSLLVLTSKHEKSYIHFDVLGVQCINFNLCTMLEYPYLKPLVGLYVKVLIVI